MNEDAINPENEPIEQGQAIESQVEVSDSSPDSGENHEEKHNAVQDRINKITREKYEAKREADELRKRLEEAEKAKTTQPAPSNDVEAPTPPDDIYDDEAMRKYNADLIEYNRKVAEKAAADFYAKQQSQLQATELEKQKKQKVDTWLDSAQKSGIELERLQQAENAINAVGINDQLAEHLMVDPNGPALAVHLANNPALMHEVLSLSPTAAAVRLEALKPEALSSTPKVSKAPEPTPEFSGGGVAEKDDFSRMFPDAKII